jgi:hypothetical protein
VAAVLTDGSNDQSSDGDEVAAVNPSVDNALEAKWSEVGGQDECGGEWRCSECLL